MTTGDPSPGWSSPDTSPTMAGSGISATGTSPIYVPSRATAIAQVPVPRADYRTEYRTAYAQPYGPYPPPMTYVPPPRPPVKHSVLRWFVVVVCVLFICAFGAVGAVFGISDLAGLNQPVAAWRTPSAEIAPPAQNAPTTEWTDWAKRALTSLLRDQADALVKGDENRFLALADPENAQLVNELHRRFAVLSQMGVGVWNQSLRSAPKPSGERAWDADIKISYCFGDKTCTTVGLVVSSHWEFKNNHMVMVDLKKSDPDQLGPRPWEVDDLKIGSGDRVVIAASKSEAWRVQDAVAAADRAAKVADTFSKWEAPPSRYVIFLASAEDWATWYGHEQPEWAAAWAVPVSNTVTEVVVRTDAVQPRGLEQLLTHELTHVTSLAGKRDGANRSAWWLIEGIADYATMINKQISEYDALQPTRSFVRNKWNGDPAVDPPSVDASLEEASARYGVAFLAVRRISEVYGQDKMLQFFGRIVHDNDSAETAAQQALGANWSTVKVDCASWIKSAVL